MLPEYYDKYAIYLKTWVEHYRNTLGFDIKWLSVQNEPEVTANYATCLFTSSEMDIVAAKVADAIHSAGLPTLVGAPENTSLEETYKFMSNFSSAIQSKLDFVPTHFYGTDNNEFAFNDLREFGRPLMASEICFTNTNDPSINDGLYWGKQAALALDNGYSSY